MRHFLVCCLTLTVCWTGIDVVPQGEAALRIGRFGSVRPHTLYPGVYWVWPFFERLERFETRDRVFLGQPQRVFTKDGRRARLGGVLLRYRLDPERLLSIQGVRPLEFESRFIAPLVASQFDALAPSYDVQELTVGKREQYRAAVADSIAQKLVADGIVTRDVLVQDLAEDQPLRSACMGSTAEARSAGPSTAESAETASSPMAAASAQLRKGSFGQFLPGGSEPEPRVGQRKSEQEPCRGQAKAFTDDLCEHVAARGSERHADADFGGAAGGGVKT